MSVQEGEAPRLVKLLHVEGDAIRYTAAAHEVLDGAKPIVVAAVGGVG